MKDEWVSTTDHWEVKPRDPEKEAEEKKKAKGTQLDAINLHLTVNLFTHKKQLRGTNITTQSLHFLPNDRTEEKYKLWIHVDNINLNEYIQKKEHLSEISIWFSDKDVVRLQEFLNKNIREKQKKFK